MVINIFFWKSLTKLNRIPWVRYAISLVFFKLFRVFVPGLAPEQNLIHDLSESSVWIQVLNSSKSLKLNFSLLNILEKILALRDMNRKAFAERLREIKMSEYDAQLYEQYAAGVRRQAVLWIRNRSDQKLFAGSGVGSGTNHSGSGSGQPLSGMNFK